jgi:hypothetical protein
MPGNYVNSEAANLLAAKGDVRNLPSYSTVTDFARLRG